MSNIHSNEEALECVAEALNYLEEHYDSPRVDGIQTKSARIVFDHDAWKWYVETFTPKVKEGD
jgi:hypothetical protein